VRPAPIAWEGEVVVVYKAGSRWAPGKRSVRDTLLGRLVLDGEVTRAFERDRDGIWGGPRNAMVRRAIERMALLDSMRRLASRGLL
jgi:hypothetical protein